MTDRNEELEKALYTGSFIERDRQRIRDLFIAEGREVYDTWAERYNLLLDAHNKCPSREKVREMRSLLEEARDWIVKRPQRGPLSVKFGERVNQLLAELDGGQSGG